MAYYDSKQDVEVTVICSECKHEQTVTVSLGINLNAAEVSEISVESVS